MYFYASMTRLRPVLTPVPTFSQINLRSFCDPPVGAQSPYILVRPHIILRPVQLLSCPVQPMSCPVLSCPVPDTCLRLLTFAYGSVPGCLRLLTVRCLGAYVLLSFAYGRVVRTVGPN